MRQVNEAEMVWNVKYALRRASTTRKKDLASNERGKRDVAEQIVSQEIVAALARYQVLSDTPLPEDIDLFSRAAYSDPPLPVDISRKD
ncbi:MULTISPECIES: hypothetical protein [Sphingomonas]|jgi:hypothetical protein|uniref:hypothetical protein n=1 Tax=Sphingomonas TaxID=13687 RepID=UPI001AE62B66